METVTRGADLSEVSFMIVDDNQFMRSLIKTILNAFHVGPMFEAADGADAFKLMAGGIKPDIILTNWAMPTLDGCEFTKLVRTADDSPNPYVPIIMISAHSEKARVEAARDAGINEFLAKPLSARALYERIIRVIEKPRPFVRVKGYFGPDRRRRPEDDFSGPERRTEKPEDARGAGD
jgi:CheY-like chemotaxis protein